LHRTLLIAAAAGAMFLAIGCSSDGGGTDTPTLTPTPEVTTEPTSTASPTAATGTATTAPSATITAIPEPSDDKLLAATDAARAALAERIGLPLSEFRLLRGEPVTWSDGCLGLAESGELCTDALVPGWAIWIYVIDAKAEIRDQATYQYRTDLEGNAVRFETGPMTADTAKAAPIPADALPRDETS
jgi:hypothetical protein